MRSRLSLATQNYGPASALFASSLLFEDYQKIIVTLFAGGGILTSCQDRSAVEPTRDTKVLSTQDEYFITFMGFKVLKPATVSQKVFDLKTNQEVAQFLGYIPRTSTTSRVAQLAVAIPIPVFFDALEKIARKYPNLEIQPYREEDKRRITKDFPALKTEEEMYNNSHVIVGYYDRLIQFDLSKELPKLGEATKGGRVARYGEDANVYEQMWTSIYPVAGLCAYNARFDSQHWTDERFGSHIPDDWKGNTFKHAVWNAQGVRKMINSGYDRYEAYQLMKLFATAHEQDPALGGIVDGNNIHVCMDLHNNVQGRTYMKNNTTWGLFGLRRMPSEDNIKNDWQYHCNNYVLYKTSAIDILNLTYGNVNAIADANYVSFGYAVKIIN